MIMMVMMMIMMTMMMMRMRMKTICDIINKSRVKLKVVMIIQIALVTAQSKGHCSLLIEIESQELKIIHLCSGLIVNNIMLPILNLSMPSIDG